MLQDATLKFLKGLKKNNNKPWFDKHKADYENAKEDFENFIQKLIDAHSKKDHDLRGLTGKKSVFRIYRDVRFSKNKTPYKNNFAASMDRGGRKSGFAGYYFHLEPGQSFIGAGIWQPEPAALKNIRQEIDYNYKEFKSILQRPGFKKIYDGLYTGEDVQLKKIPQGFEKDNPAGEYLKFKSWMVLSDLDDKQLTSSTLLKRSLEAMEAAMPFIHFINHALVEQE